MAQQKGFGIDAWFYGTFPSPQRISAMWQESNTSRHSSKYTPTFNPVKVLLKKYICDILIDISIGYMHNQSDWNETKQVQMQILSLTQLRKFATNKLQKEFPWIWIL